MSNDIAKEAFREMILNAVDSNNGHLLLSLYEASHPMIEKLVEEGLLSYGSGGNKIYSAFTDGQKFIVSVIRGPKTRS